jgi:hypothetical protein
MNQEGVELLIYSFCKHHYLDMHPNESSPLRFFPGLFVSVIPVSRYARIMITVGVN